MLDGLQRGILRKNCILEKTKRKQRETNYSLEKNINIKIKEQMSQRNCIIYTIKCFVWWFMRDMKVSILQKKYKTPDWWLKFIFSAVIACYCFILYIVLFSKSPPMWLLLNSSFEASVATKHEQTSVAQKESWTTQGSCAIGPFWE